MDLLNLPRAILGLFLSFIYVLSGIRTRIVGEEGEHADHLTLFIGQWRLELKSHFLSVKFKQNDAREFCQFWSKAKAIKVNQTRS